MLDVRAIDIPRRFQPPIRRSPSRANAMDIAYLLLLAALVGLTAGYLHLCATLEERK